MSELNIIMNKYNNGEYDIEDVSRSLSYMAISDELIEALESAENEIENIRFLCSDNEQKEAVKKVLENLIAKVNQKLDVNE